MNTDSCTTFGAMLYAVDRAAAIRKRLLASTTVSQGRSSSRSQDTQSSGFDTPPAPAPAAQAPAPMPLWHEATPAVRERYRSVSALLTQRFRTPVIGKRFDLLSPEEFRGLIQSAGIALHDPDTALALFMDVAPTLFD